MNDNVKTFNIASDKYAKYRPRYPKEFYTYLLEQVEQKDKMWDCACGTGQVSIDLVDKFNQIYATDINENQLANALKNQKITYAILPSEKTNFPDNFFDLICVAQALHWFDIEKFFQEADRVLKPNGVLAVFGYGFFSINKQIDLLLDRHLHTVIKKYWAAENQLVINGFKGIRFPFKEISCPEYEINLVWNLHDMIAYISTWSAVKKYNLKNKNNIEDHIYDLLKNVWVTKKTVKMNFFCFIRKKDN